MSNEWRDIKIEAIQAANVKHDAWKEFYRQSHNRIEPWLLYHPLLVLFLPPRRQEYFERRVRNQKEVVWLPDLFGAEKAQVFEVGNVNAGGAADPWL